MTGRALTISCWTRSTKARTMSCRISAISQSRTTSCTAVDPQQTQPFWWMRQSACRAPIVEDEQICLVVKHW